jgi:heat shock protein HslJ/membrane-bound inhibitor of C-type lysozyme
MSRKTGRKPAVLNASGTVVAGVAFFILGAGCAQGEAAEAEPFPTEFECGNRSVRARFLGDAMELDTGGEVFRMRSVVAASGAKYQAENDPSTIFWNKGREAFVQIRGQALGVCAVAASTEPAAPQLPLRARGNEPAAPQLPLRARGNEPAWNLTIRDAEIELVTDYGATRSTFPKPAPEASGDMTRYVVAEANLTITILERPCADTMSGMFYPLTVTVEGPEGVLSGCGGEPASLLLGPERVVERIDGDRLIGDSRATIAFQEGGRVAGLASCNRYTATYRLTGEGLSIVGGASTMMACEPALMGQERRFLDALAAVTRFEIAPDGALVLAAGDRPKLVARR